MILDDHEQGEMILYCDNNCSTRVWKKTKNLTIHLYNSSHRHFSQSSVTCPWRSQCEVIAEQICKLDSVRRSEAPHLHHHPPPPSMHNRDGQVPVGVSDWDKQRQVDYITRQLHLVLHCQSVHRSGLCHSSQLSKPPYWTEDCRYSKPHAKGLSLVWLPLTTTYSIISYREYHFNLRLFDLQPPFQEHNKGLNKGNLYTVQVNRNNLFTLWTALDIFREPGYRSLAPRYKPQGPGIEFRHEEERFLVSKTLETCSGVQPDSYSIGRLQLKCDDTGWRTGGEVKGKLANGVGSQYSSHYLGTWCIQHYYRWCANLGCQ